MKKALKVALGIAGGIAALAVIYTGVVAVLCYLFGERLPEEDEDYDDADDYFVEDDSEF